jgi:hypothetical protein
MTDAEARSPVVPTRSPLRRLTGCREEPELYGSQPMPESITASVIVEPTGRGNYQSEAGNRVVVTPIYSPYPLSYEAGSRFGPGPKLWLLMGVPRQACGIGSIIHTQHANGTPTATIDWLVVNPESITQNLPRWSVKSISSTKSQ